MFNFGPGVGINFNFFDPFFTYKSLLSRLYIQILISYIFTRQEIISAEFITHLILTKSLLGQATFITCTDNDSAKTEEPIKRYLQI